MNKAYVFRMTVALSFAMAGPVLADKITLQNGRILEGTIVDSEADPIVLDMEGSKVRIPKDKLLEIVYEELPVQPSRPSYQRRLGAIASQADDESGDEQALKQEDIIRFNAHMDRIVPSEHADEDMSMTPERKKEFYKVVAMGSKITPLLENKLAKPKGNGQVVALQAIEAIDRKKGQELARSVAVEHKNADLREEALRILAKGGSKNDVPVFEAALGDSQGSVRAAAVESLSNSNDPKYVPNFIAALDDPVPSVREAAQKALAHAVPNQKFKTSDEWRQWGESKFESIPKSYQEPVNTGTKWTLGNS